MGASFPSDETSAVAPARQRRLAARWYVRHQRPYAAASTIAVGLAHLARAPLLEDTLLRMPGEPTPEWLRAAATVAGS